MPEEVKPEENKSIIHYPFRSEIVEKKCIDIAKVIFDTTITPPLSLEEAYFILGRFQKSLDEVKLNMQYRYLTEEFLVPLLAGKPVEPKPLSKDSSYFA